MHAPPAVPFRALRQAVVELDIDDLAPDHIIAFPHHLEKVRSNSVATRNRNARLAAVHVFARFVATNHPEQLELCQRFLAVPCKPARTRMVEHLEADEVAAGTVRTVPGPEHFELFR